MVHQPTGCPRFPPRLVASNLVATTTVNRKMSSKVDEIWKDRCVKICVDIVLDVCMKKARFNLQSRSLCFSLPFSLLLFEASELMSKPGLTLAQMPEESMFGLDNGQGLGRFSKFPLGFLLYFLNLGYHEGRLLRNILSFFQAFLGCFGICSTPSGQNEKKNPWSWASSTTAATAKSFDEVPCAYQSSSTASMIQAINWARSSEVLEQCGKF